MTLSLAKATDDPALHAFDYAHPLLMLWLGLPLDAKQPKAMILPKPRLRPRVSRRRGLMSRD